MLVMEMTRNHCVELQGKSIEVTLTDRARTALSRRTLPITAEMELYFSCLIRKQVRFYDSSNHDINPTMETRLNDRMRIRFRPVMTKACGKDYEGKEPPLTDFPIENSKAYIPHWLKIDFTNNEWVGEYGYRSKN